MTAGILTFECMLASSEIPTPEQVPLDSLLSFKYDGMRALLTGNVAMSRQMIAFPNKFLQDFVQYNSAYLHGLDCELIVGPPNTPQTFNTTQSAIMSAEGRPDFKLYVLDHWDMEGESAEDRYEYLKDFIGSLPGPVAERVVLVEQHRAYKHAQIPEFNLQAVAQGYEGTMCKRADGFYKYGRSTLKEGILLKFKDFKDSEIRIDKLYQGVKNGNEKGQSNIGKAKRSSHKANQIPQDIIGAFEGVDINPTSPFFGQTVKAGPGNFTKDLLKLLWKKHMEWLAGGCVGESPVIGRILVYKYQVSGVKDKPRMPTAKGFRSKIDMSAHV
jgi:DNA ligase-1